MIKEYDNLLSNSNFVCVQHGHLINSNHVVRIDKANMILHLNCDHYITNFAEEKGAVARSTIIPQI